MAENILHRRKVDALQKLSDEELLEIVTKKGELWEEAKDILDAMEAGKSNEQRYKELLDEQGEISGKAKKSYSLYKYIDKKERPQLGGVYHKDGYAIATDTYVLVADRRKYEKANDGRIIDKDGNEIEGRFPNAFAVVPRRIIASDIDAMDLLNFIAGVKAIVKSKNEKLKDKVILFNVGGELWAGSVENLEKFANAAVSLGGKIYFNDNVGTGIYTRPIYTESDKGFALLMPIDFTRDSIDKENYFAYNPSEIGAETDSMVSKEKHQFAEGSELRMVQELTDKSRNDMQTVARSIGVELVFDDTLKENGRYTTIDKATGRPTIHVAMNASNPLESVFGHEATHRVKSLDNESYSELHDVARLMIGDEEFFDRAKQKKELYAKNGIALSDADAREEVVSDYIGSLIYYKEHMGKVADKLSHPILSKIRDVVSDFLDYFRKNKMTADERLAKGSLRAIDRAFANAANSVNPNSKSPVTKFQIIGEKGAEALDKAQEATIRMDNLSVAREMEKAGKDAKTIRLATGWERGADGKWRYEIPDEYNIDGSDMILDRYIERMEEKRNKLLKIYNEKSKLYNNYGRLLYYIETEIKSIPTRNSTAEQKEKRKALQKKRKDILKEQNNIGLFNARDDYDNLKRDLDLKWTNLLEVLGEKHPLFDAYPQFKNIHVTYDSKGETNFLGYYIKEWNQIWINPNVRRNQSSIFAHEIQHAIQYEEGFARGGSAEEMQKDFDDAKQEVSARIWMRALQEKAKGSVNKTTKYIEEELIKDYEQEGLDDMIPDLVTRDIGREYYERGYADTSKDEKIKRFNLDTSLGDNFNAFKSYRSIAGEVESRNVEARMNMSEHERRETLLADTEDVSRKDQIFLFNNLRESQMGSRVDKRMAEVGEYFGRKELSDNERAVVDVFSGKSDNKAITVERDGKQHKVVMRQGNENKAGTKHSLFRHYGTNSGVISSEDLLLIPEVIERGEKEVKGNGIAYKLKKDGVVYTVYNEIHKNQEQFCDFYTNRKGSSTHPSNTQLSAQVDSATTNSDTKVVENFENPTIESKKYALSADGDKYSLRKGGKEYRNNGYTQRDKFSVRANDELEKKSLVGIHNLTDDNLRYAIKLGGLANPSTAVVDTDIIGLEGFGDISMIMPKSLVDKRTGKNVGTYAGDAYTPRFPKGDIVKHISSKGEKKINQDYQGNDRFSRDFREAWHNYGNEYGGITPTLYYLYKLENGGADVVKQEGPKIKSEYHRMMIDKYGDKEWIELSDVDKQELVEYRRKEIKESLKNVEKSMVDKVVDDLINSSDFDTLAYKKYRSLKMDYNEQKNAGDVDYKGTYNKAQNDVIMSGEHDKFAKWLDEKSIRYEIEDRIFRGYTPSGNRKYAPLTLSNISKVMKESGRAGSETLMGGSPHSLRGKMLPSYKTLESIKKNKGRLSDKETYERIRDEINNEYNELISTIRDIKGVDYNDAYYILEDALLKGFDYAEREAGITIDSNTKERISAFGKLLKESPVKYFETKFERPVMLNEFVAAVVPKDIDAELKNSLIDNGIAIEEYERGNEESRLYAIKRASNREDVKFSLRDDGSMIEGAEEAKPVTLRSILSDRNIGLKEQITLSKALLAEQNKSDKTLLNDFVRSVTDNLSDVRKAMSAQKVYDQATVKRVADLAKIMLSTGHLSNLGKGEQGRQLLRIVPEPTTMTRVFKRLWTLWSAISSRTENLH